MQTHSQAPTHTDARTQRSGETHRLYDGWVREDGRRGRRVIDQQVLDVTGTEDDVLVHLVARSHRLVRHAVLGSEGADCVVGV